MSKKAPRKLRIAAESLRTLSAPDLAAAAGGKGDTGITSECPKNSYSGCGYC